MPIESLSENTQRLIAAGLPVGFTIAALVYYAVTRFLARRLGAGEARRLAAEVIRSESKLGAVFLIFLGLLLGPLGPARRGGLAGPDRSGGDYRPRPDGRKGEY